MGCPFEGAINSTAVASVAKRLYELGCYEISLGDTIGTGTPGIPNRKFIEFSSNADVSPGLTFRMINEVSKYVPTSRLAMHFHDTYGQALSNILIGLQV
jgi:hydroxymethylglutaryl-CoA lyase